MDYPCALLEHASQEHNVSVKEERKQQRLRTHERLISAEFQLGIGRPDFVPLKKDKKGMLTVYMKYTYTQSFQSLAESVARVDKSLGSAQVIDDLEREPERP